MTKSKMREVAKLLEVELDEEFNVIGSNWNPYKITEGGMFDCRGRQVHSVFYGLLKGHLKIKKPILDEVEKHYLESVLRPFKDKISFIIKYDNFNNSYRIRVYICDGEDYLRFPYFKKGTMYKSMEDDKKYTLKELGLFED